MRKRKSDVLQQPSLNEEVDSPNGPRNVLRSIVETDSGLDVEVSVSAYEAHCLKGSNVGCSTACANEKI